MSFRESHESERDMYCLHIPAQHILDPEYLSEMGLLPHVSDIYHPVHVIFFHPVLYTGEI